jgi:glycosyltransferase involved in cell wall biosynthesis
MIAPAPVIRTCQGYILDAKFIEGMRLHCRFWPGEVDCILREGATQIQFGAREVSLDLGFGLQVLQADEPISARLLQGYDLVLCSADDFKNLGIVDLQLAPETKIFFTIEYILETRLQIAWLNPDRSLLRRLYSVLWLLRQEVRVRRAIKRAHGVQANGYPAFQLYGNMNNNALLYLDNRMSPELFATQAEVDDRVERLTSGSPLRLVYSGRLEVMKGVHDLLPIAEMLREQGTPFTLEIFGDGSLRDQIEQGIAEAGLENNVRLHESMDFESELIPHIRKNADIYLCCHRQSDPSCTYLENMGCGLAVMGYGNRMWTSLNKESAAGWVVPMGNQREMAAAIRGVDADRKDAAKRCKNALEFAKANNFLSEFRKRMNHLANGVGLKQIMVHVNQKTAHDCVLFPNDFT